MEEKMIWDYEELSNAIVRQACADYLEAHKKLKALNDVESARASIRRRMVRAQNKWRAQRRKMCGIPPSIEFSNGMDEGKKHSMIQFIGNKDFRTPFVKLNPLRKITLKRIEEERQCEMNIQEREIKDCLRFFRSRWYSVLCDVPPDHLIKKLDELREKGIYRVGCV